MHIEFTPEDRMRFHRLAKEAEAKGADYQLEILILEEEEIERRIRDYRRIENQWKALVELVGEDTG